MDPNNLSKFTETTGSISTISTDPHPEGNTRVNVDTYYIPPTSSFSAASSPDPRLYSFQSGTFHSVLPAYPSMVYQRVDPHPEENTRVNEGTYYIPPIWPFPVAYWPDPRLSSFQSGNCHSVLPVYPWMGCHRVDQGPSRSSLGDSLGQVSQIRQIGGGQVSQPLNLSNSARYKKNSARRIRTTPYTQQYSSFFRRVSPLSAAKSPLKNNVSRNDCNYTTADGKQTLKVILQKELTKSDLDSFGRILLPKTVSETFLPTLYVNEVIDVAIREADSAKIWHMRYRSWVNNSSRMYVLQNTGEYVKQNQLQPGDILMLFQDEAKQLYISSRKVQNQSSSSGMDAHQRLSAVDNAKHYGTSTSGIQLSTKIPEPSHSEGMSETDNAKCEQYISSTKVQNQSSSSLMDEHQRMPAIDDANHDGKSISGIQLSTKIAESSHSEDMSGTDNAKCGQYISSTKVQNPSLSSIMDEHQRMLAIDDANHDGKSTSGIQLSTMIAEPSCSKDMPRTYNAECEQYIFSRKVHNQSLSSIMDEHQRLPAIEDAKHDGKSTSRIQLSTMIAELSCSEDMSRLYNAECEPYISSRKVQNQFPSSILDEFQTLPAINNVNHNGKSPGIQLSTMIAEPSCSEDMSMKELNGTGLTHNEDDFAGLEDFGDLGEFDFSIYEV